MNNFSQIFLPHELDRDRNNFIDNRLTFYLWYIVRSKLSFWFTWIMVSRAITGESGSLRRGSWLARRVDHPLRPLRKPTNRRAINNCPSLIARRRVYHLSRPIPKRLPWRLYIEREKSSVIRVALCIDDLYSSSRPLASNFHGGIARWSSILWSSATYIIHYARSVDMM